MSKPNAPMSPTGGSFIPEDYLRQKVETRANIINLILFGVVLFGVIGAFFVTHRQWGDVRLVQAEINRSFATEAAKIEQLKLLESQKAEMVEKAEITAALLERVPRSILMAELINRMPEKLTLSELELKSTRPKEIKAPPASAQNQPKSLAAKPASGAAGGKDEKAAKPRPPKIEFALALTGLAASDSDVADYHAKLKSCPLLDKVELISAKEVKIEDVAVREFRIEASIRTSADARSIEPLQVPRLRSNMRAVTTANPAASPK